MAHGERISAGYVSDTERASFLADLFETVGVRPSRLAVNDARVRERAHRDCVAVQEGVDVDMRPDEFSAFMELAHALVRSHPDTRFATSDLRCLVVPYAAVDAMRDDLTPVEAGERLVDPSTMTDDETDDDAEEQAENDAEDQMSDNPETEGQQIEGTDWDESVIWVGGHEYIVETSAGWQRVDLANEAVPSIDEAALKILALALPASFEPDQRLTMAHIELVGQAVGVAQDAQQLLQSGAVAGGGGGAGGGSEDEGELLQDVPNDYDEYDLEALEDDLWDWLESYADFESDFDPEIVEIEKARVKGSVGFHLDTNPFKAGYHGGQGGDWEDKDGYETAQEAFRELMQNKDEIDYYGEPDYVNHLPAAKVEDVI